MAQKCANARQTVLSSVLEREDVVLHMLAKSLLHSSVLDSMRPAPASRQACTFTYYDIVVYVDGLYVHFHIPDE